MSFDTAYPIDINEIDDFVEYQKHLDHLSEDLKRHFSYLGLITVNHFLTDWGFPVLKPDRMVMRLLYRSHLVKLRNPPALQVVMS